MVFTNHLYWLWMITLLFSNLLTFMGCRVFYLIFMHVVLNKKLHSLLAVDIYFTLFIFLISITFRLFVNTFHVILLLFFDHARFFYSRHFLCIFYVLSSRLFSCSQNIFFTYFIYDRHVKGTPKLCILHKSKEDVGEDFLQHLPFNFWFLELELNGSDQIWKASP